MWKHNSYSTRRAGSLMMPRLLWAFRLWTLCGSMRAGLCFLVSFKIWSSFPFIHLHLFLDCWCFGRVLTSFFISSSISFTFYIRNLVLHSKFLVAHFWQRAFFNHILLLQTISFTVAIILVKLIYYSNYGQFQVCYQVNCCQHALITVSPYP